MSDSNSIINLGELSKPANTLIERISDAIGGIFKPYQIRRVAQAEAEAEKIHAVSQFEVSELQRRALHRFLTEEAKKQHNIETITQKALPEVSDQGSPEKLEDDWITNFFDKCRLVSDEEMQSLWARVLSGEANSPGKFAKRTVNLLVSLDRSDAELFSKLCSFGFFLGDIVPLIYSPDAPIYNEHGINFVTLSHLDSIGLIQFDALSQFARTGVRQKGGLLYYGKSVFIEFTKPDKNSFNAGHVLLTKAGQQLALICGSKPREGFLEYVQEMWKSFGYKVDPDGK